MAMMASTTGVGLVEPTTPVRPGLVWVKAGTWRERLRPLGGALAGTASPPAPATMQSVQMGRSQCAHSTEAARSGWR